MQYNLLFKGDNFEALNALKKTHINSVKCVYLDPPYNTGVNRKHFADDRESDEWVHMMRERLVIIKTLMKEDASLWISIDDSELCNLKRLCNEIFGKDNLLATITWQHEINWDGYKGLFKLDHSYLLCYRKSKSFKFENNIKPKTVWLEGEVGGHKDSINESTSLFGPDNIFSTPKPERFLSYILEISTGKGDIVLDGFSGSGTMGAVAQKLGRKWIMMEIGDQCENYILKRMSPLAQRIDFNDKSSIKIENNENQFIYFSNVSSYFSFYS